MVLTALFPMQRELARQTNDIIVSISQYMENEGFPAIRSGLCIGGVAVKEQMDVIHKYVIALM